MLSRIAGVLMLAVFGLNVYIGLYDRTLTQLNTVHYTLNWLIVVVDLVAAIVLLAMPRSISWVSLGGIVWPIVFIFFLFIDIETTLCLGTNFNCWPSITDAYDYLILGSSTEGWVLWPYTMRFVIALLIAVIILSIASLRLGSGEFKTQQSTTQKPHNTNQEEGLSTRARDRSGNPVEVMCLRPDLNSSQA